MYSIFNKTLHRQITRPLNFDLMISAEKILSSYFFTVLALAPKYTNDCAIQGGWNDENSFLSDNHLFMNNSLYFRDK